MKQRWHDFPVALSFPREAWNAGTDASSLVETAVKQREERIDLLRCTQAHTRFLSCEPLIGPLANLNLHGIDWVIVGGESGRNPRPMRPGWVYQIKQQCERANLPFFFKQWGGANKKKAGRLLDGRVWDEMPRVSGC